MSYKESIQVPRTKEITVRRHSWFHQKDVHGLSNIAVPPAQSEEDAFAVAKKIMYSVLKSYETVDSMEVVADDGEIRTITMMVRE